MEIFGIPLQAFLGQLLLGLVNGSFYAMLSLGLAVIFGLLGIVNFAHGALYMIGAYVAWLALEKFGLNYWAALVLAPGDVNLTFKRYLSDAVSLRIVDDHVTAIEGRSVDADLMRGYFAAWNEPAAYAVSHVGWGLNRRARWDAMTFYDKADFNGTELRAFAGSFLYSTGANEVANRHTLGHFDLPMRGCTVSIDGVAVVDGGVLV